MGRVKSMPPASSIFWNTMFFDCFDPRALPSTTTSPSTTPTTGLMESMPPTRAAAPEMRPPRRRYSSVSSEATSRMSFFSWLRQ